MLEANEYRAIKHGTLARFHQLVKESIMSTLDEGLMATLTQEERDAMKEDDLTTKSVGENDEPIDEALDYRQ